jgi:hypothetical protein
VDRRIILTIKKAVATSQNEEPIVSESKTIAQDDIQDDKDTWPPGFAVLNVDSDDSSESGGVNAREEAGTADKSPAMNKLLGDLAKERLQRQQQAKKAVGHANVVAGGGKKKERKKKLGNNKTKPVNEASTIDDATEEMDDMAFLNAQIEKVQTSHGRKIEGKGEYRTIINGILIGKPPAREEKKNTQASSALSAKLKQAQDDRKAKKTGKKKR